PTFQEVIDLSRRMSAELHRNVGIVPEIKHSTYFKNQGLAIEPKFVDILNRNGLNRPDAKVVLQSFEVTNLVELRKVLRIQFVQLTSATGAPFDLIAKGDPRTYADIVSPKGLRDVARYAQWIGPDKNQVIGRDATNHLLPPTSLVSDAHKAGLKVVAY